MNIAFRNIPIFLFSVIPFIFFYIIFFDTTRITGRRIIVAILIIMTLASFCASCVEWEESQEAPALALSIFFVAGILYGVVFDFFMYGPYIERRRDDNIRAKNRAKERRKH